MDKESIRGKLKELYDSFVEKYGNLNKTKNRNIINKDSYGFTVLASLEKRIGSDWFPSDILTRSNKVENEEPRTSSVSEALAYTLAMKGYIDMSMIERITDMEPELIISELGDLVYYNPMQDYWEESSKWNSGNIYSKIAQCEFMLAEVMNDKNSVYLEKFDITDDEITRAFKKLHNKQNEND